MRSLRTCVLVLALVGAVVAPSPAALHFDFGGSPELSPNTEMLAYTSFTKKDYQTKIRSKGARLKGINADRENGSVSGRQNAGENVASNSRPDTARLGKVIKAPQPLLKSARRRMLVPLEAIIRSSLSSGDLLAALDLRIEGNKPAADIKIKADPVNEPPFVVTPIEDMTVNEGAPPDILEIANHFDDADIATVGDQLTLTVAENTNPSLVFASFTGSELTLEYQPGQTGEATITVLATDSLGASVENSFLVIVYPPGGTTGSSDPGNDGGLGGGPSTAATSDGGGGGNGSGSSVNGFHTSFNRTGAGIGGGGGSGNPPGFPGGGPNFPGGGGPGDPNGGDDPFSDGDDHWKVDPPNPPGGGYPPGGGDPPGNPGYDPPTGGDGPRMDPTPEPATVVIWSVLGLAVLAWRRWRRDVAC